MRILGYKYSVAVEDRDAVQGSGYMNGNGQKIRIGIHLCQEQRESTLLHEVIEAINCHLELKLEHPQIMALECALYTTLRDAGVRFDEILDRATQKETP